MHVDVYYEAMKIAELNPPSPIMLLVIISLDTWAIAFYIYKSKNEFKILRTNLIKWNFKKSVKYGSFPAGRLQEQNKN